MNLRASDRKVNAISKQIMMPVLLQDLHCLPNSAPELYECNVSFHEEKYLVGCICLSMLLKVIKQFSISMI